MWRSPGAGGPPFPITFQPKATGSAATNTLTIQNIALSELGPTGSQSLVVAIAEAVQNGGFVANYPTVQWGGTSLFRALPAGDGGNFVAGTWTYSDAPGGMHDLVIDHSGSADVVGIAAMVSVLGGVVDTTGLGILRAGHGQGGVLTNGPISGNYSASGTNPPPKSFTLGYAIAGLSTGPINTTPGLWSGITGSRSVPVPGSEPRLFAEGYQEMQTPGVRLVASLALNGPADNWEIMLADFRGPA